MTDLSIEACGTDTALADWRHVHNTVIPAHILSADEVRERAGRHRLAVAYRDGDLVGCSTVRPPTAEDPNAATVIARVLPEHRRQGLGSQIYAHALATARQLGAEVIDTVVLASNQDGLEFALAHGFAETERYELPGETVPWIDLRLVSPGR
ncbi:GNAT family N-acetyltransferase [Stackebrandtia nassauensis]|uniref:GCN5-related N-acetyltransferase n=1 Tax=Stackebrandtia nassauensis (strain DSM 44728 / CIP 108903 / NRRL B-16338 / NBRC 102104 / LLR-40K-21) TaxID=446470 RepID=D3Q2I4_STANL|nr:GNAT family N-acetyltransferase [Stackebrandtia nassauensis]ADD43917.1 GCN5-related N-acetyltransferase [Stackebrandtia nassauensis DSM 44728]